MATNEHIRNAQAAKKDEFYTQYKDIQKELVAYKSYFAGKSVYCNCDDPVESNFCKFFLNNFKSYGLRRLVCTTYDDSSIAGTQLSLFGENEAVTMGYGQVIDIRTAEEADRCLIDTPTAKAVGFLLQRPLPIQEVLHSLRKRRL